MPNFFQNALTLFPSYYSSFFPPDVGPTKFSQTSIYGDFLSNVGTDGLGLSQRFIAYIESPWLDDNFDFRATQFDKRMMLRAFSVNIPSKYLSTIDRDISGPKRRIPYTASFDDDLTIQFYCSPDMSEYGFMQKWVDGIVDPVSRYVSFYDDFAKDTKITLLFIPNTIKTMDEIIQGIQSKSIQGIRFTEVYPRTFNANGGTVEWSNNTKPMFVNVSFVFREAVDVTTYDDNVSAALLELAEITPGVSPPMETAVNGRVVQPNRADMAARVLYGGGKGLVRSAVNKLFNFPSSGTPIADNGGLRIYTPPPPGNGV